MADLPSLDEMAARAERFDQAQLALRRELATQVVHGRDDHDLVEVGADANGQIVEVALNATLVGRVDPTCWPMPCCRPPVPRNVKRANWSPSGRLTTWVGVKGAHTR